MVNPNLTKPLTFSKEAKALLTPFRLEALETIYKAAKAELGASLKSAYVFTWVSPEEEAGETFVLSISTNTDWEEIKRVYKSILFAVSEKSSSWTKEQKRDYSEKIYFELDSFDE